MIEINKNNYVIVINDFMFDLIGIHDFMFDVVTVIGIGNSSAIYTLKSMKIFPFRIWTYKRATFGFIATFRSSAGRSSSVAPQLLQAFTSRRTIAQSRFSPAAVGVVQLHHNLVLSYSPLHLQASTPTQLQSGARLHFLQHYSRLQD